MSVLPRCIGSLICSAMVFSFVGCASMHMPFEQKKIGKATAADPVVDIVCLWQTGEGSDPDGRPCKGFSGQILFLQRSSSAPVQVEGDVRIYLFDDQGSEEEQAKPLRQFDFDNGSWAIHLTNSSFGPAYNVFIPYVRRGVSNAACSLRVRLKPKEGLPVFSDFSNMSLNGYKKAVGNEAKPITKEEVDSLAVEGFSGQLRRTTTIATNPTSPAAAIPLAKKEIDAGQIQQASHEVGAPTTDSAEAQKIRRLESMLEQLLEQKAGSSPMPTTSVPQPRIETPVDQPPRELQQDVDDSRSSRRLKMRKNDDEVPVREAAVRKTPARRAHPLDDDAPVQSRSKGDEDADVMREDSDDANADDGGSSARSDRSVKYRRSSR